MKFRVYLTHCGLVTPYGDMDLGLVIIYVISYNSGPCCNGTQLYNVFEGKTLQGRCNYLYITVNSLVDGFLSWLYFTLLVLKLEYFGRSGLIPFSFMPWYHALPGPIFYTYHKISNIRRTKSQNLNVSHLVLKSSLPYPLKPGVTSRMKM